MDCGRRNLGSFLRVESKCKGELNSYFISDRWVNYVLRKVKEEEGFGDSLRIFLRGRRVELEVNRKI